MKKLYTALLLLLLVSAVTFGQISGAVNTRMTLFDYVLGDEDEEDIWIYGLIHTAHITLTGSGSGGRFGGQIRITVDTDDYYGHVLERPWHKAFVWWQPHQQFRMFLGQDPDGQFETAVLAGYNFHEGDEQFIGVMVWDFWRAIFPGNWDTFGLAFTYRPIRGVQLNLIVPTGGPDMYEWPRHTNDHIQRLSTYREMFPWGLRFSGSAAIPDAGTVYFSYTGPFNFGLEADYVDVIRDDEGDFIHYGDIGVSFLLRGPVQGLQAQVGISTRIPSFADELWPVMAGVAAHYTNTFNLQNTRIDWGTKLRFGAAFNTSDSLGDDNFLQQSQRSYFGNDETKQKATFIHGNVMPWVKISDWNIFFDIGMTGLLNDIDSEKEFTLGWWLSPYVKIGPLKAGIHVMTVGDIDDQYGRRTTSAGWRARKVNEDNPVRITVPIAMEFQF